MTRAPEFFDESRDQSRIKSRIVAEYFWVWAKVVMRAAKSHGGRIAYVDLFAGPGRYEDGTDSTPILVLKQALDDLDTRETLVTLFNDKNRNHAESLSQAIHSLPGIEGLKFKPQVQNEEVGAGIVGLLERTKSVPTLFFVDPWGYKGLSLALIGSALRDWGCDCIFFFNYNRINAALSNPTVCEHMDTLFGKGRADDIRRKLATLKPGEREFLIIEEISEALGELGAPYVLPFCFRNERGTRSTHYLIFASKSFKGYEIMKDIMARESSDKEQGVPSFAYSPASAKFPVLFELSRPLDELEEGLLERFAGQRLRMRDVYVRDSVGKPYIGSNYKRALANIEAAGKIAASPPAEERPKRDGQATFGNNVVVTFPRRNT